MSTKIIALDAGHSLNTAGKRTPDGIREWTLNDKVRDYVVDYLKEYDVKIIYPDNNEGKTDESLTSRKSMYVNAKVDAAVSIHHNANTGSWNNATGVETWIDRNYTSADMKLAKCIQTKLAKYTGLKDRGIKKEDFTVIYQNKCPAVLTEGGFMDGRSDYKVITSAEGQKAYARAVAEGLIEFLSLERKTATSTTKPASSSESAKKVVAKDTAQSFSKTLAGTYKVTANDGLHVRTGAGVTKKSLVVLPSGTKVENFGYYTTSLGIKWLYVQVTLKGVQYTGFASSKYLKK